jgi:folate-binding protein YgfZ
MSPSSAYSYSELSNRAFLMLQGVDALIFLQGLVTNDVQKVSDTNIIYGCMLTPQGKFHADFFLGKCPNNEGYLLECHQQLAQPLKESLLRYKLRAKITLEEVSADYRAFSLPTLPPLPNFQIPETLGFASPWLDGIVFRDPRLAALGLRAWLPASEEGFPPAMLASAGGVNENLKTYEHLRIELAIPEGMSDLEPGKSFPQEYGFDLLHAIDYQKGCYLGQELTARTKYRGTIRKGVYHIKAEHGIHLTPGAEVMAGEIAVGLLRSCLGSGTIALLRHEETASAMATNTAFTVEGVPVMVTRPNWLAQS